MLSMMAAGERLHQVRDKGALARSERVVESRKRTLKFWIMKHRLKSISNITKSNKTATTRCKRDKWCQFSISSLCSSNWSLLILNRPMNKWWMECNNSQCKILYLICRIRLLQNLMICLIISWPIWIPINLCRMSISKLSSSWSWSKMRRTCTTIRIYSMQWLPSSSLIIIWRRSATACFLIGFREQSKHKKREVINHYIKVKSQDKSINLVELFQRLRLILSWRMHNMKISMILNFRCSKKVLRILLMVLPVHIIQIMDRCQMTVLITYWTTRMT